MITVDIFKAREQLDKLIDDVNINNTPLTIINDKGKKCCFNLRRKVERD